MKRAAGRSRHRNVRTFWITELAHMDKLDATSASGGAVLGLHLPADRIFCGVERLEPGWSCAGIEVAAMATAEITGRTRRYVSPFVITGF